uniref:Uncharacterized protein n=1 Tax=Anopheles funestus TaxID=62324 RepID=A0A4Y0BGX3_ANOFN
MQSTKNLSVGDVLRATTSPYDAKTSPEMGQFIREARKLTRNNTLIGMEATKNASSERINLTLKESCNRWSSAENLSVNRPERCGLNKVRVGESMSTIVPLKLPQITIGTESTDDDNSGTKGRQTNDRRCSMIPLMCPPVGRPKVSHAPIERGNIVRKKPPIPPKALAKHQDPIKIFRAEREKKMDMELQLEEIREQIVHAEVSRQREDQHNREMIDGLKREIENLKCICDKLTDAVQRLQNSDDMFLKMKHEGEYSFYSRSCEVSKKILNNTFRRRKTNSARTACFQANAGTSRDAGENFHNGDQCDLTDTPRNTLRAIEQSGVSSGGDGDHSLGRSNSAPETPMNIVTSLYYISKIRSLEMDDVSPERNDIENPSLKSSEQELIAKKKTKMSKIGSWFKPGKH